MKSSVKFNITTLRGIWTLRYAIFVGEEFEVNISEDHSFNVSDTALKFNNTIGETEQRIFYFENLSLINFRWNENGIECGELLLILHTTWYPIFTKNIEETD